MSKSSQHGEKKIKDSFGHKVFVVKPSCPFCGLAINKPQELETHRPTDMPLGSCACGAVYAYDISGHNLGVAFNEALVFACNMDWDLAWGLLPDDDYLTEITEHYDRETHLVIPGGVIEGRRVKGALYFVRMHDDIQEVTQEGVEKELEKVAATAPALFDGKPWQAFEVTDPVRLSKKEVEKIIQDYSNIELLLQASFHDKKIVRKMQRLLYTPDELMRLKTAELLGKVSVIVIQKNPNAVTQVLKGMLSSVFDSASSSWGAIDAAGEIIANSPAVYAGYLPALYRLLSDEEHQASTLRAVSNIAKAKPELVQIPISHFIPYMNNDNATTRGYAAVLAGILKIPELEGELKQLEKDDHEISIYKDGSFEKTTVGQLASKALEGINTNTA